MAQLDLTPHSAQIAGWREGKPVEDPEKTRRWGFVTAKPSEYLVHVRRGRVRDKTSGQGASCFKWPWDAVAVVPTSLQRLAFRADQVTREKIGIEIVGLAVYRIAEPRIAYRVLNFSYPERAQQKLEQTLAEMCVGATRRLVANLSVEECLQKRKSALAEELVREVSPIVGGSGSPGDVTAAGWGVVIDTIEIQEVRVLSNAVFEAMQAPYRATLEQSARAARADADREIETREAENRRSVELARLAAEAQVRAERAAVERRDAELGTQAALFGHELEQSELRAELDAHTLRAAALAARTELERAERLAQAERRRSETELVLAEGRAQAELQLARAHADREQAEADARRVTAERLPALAAAVGERFGEVKVVQIGASSDVFGSIAQAVKSVVELARTA